MFGQEYKEGDYLLSPQQNMQGSLTGLSILQLIEVRDKTLKGKHYRDKSGSDIQYALLTIPIRYRTIGGMNVDRKIKTILIRNTKRIVKIPKEMVENILAL